MRNSPIYGVRIRTFLAAIPFFRTRGALGSGRKVNAEYFDASFSLSDPYSRIAPDSSLRGLFSLHGCLLSMSGHRNYSPGSGGPFPQLVGLAEVSCQSIQDSFDRQADVSPIRIIVHGRRTAIRVGRSVGAQVERPFSKFVLRLVVRLLAHVQKPNRTERQGVVKA